MTLQTISVDDRIYKYLLDSSLREPEIFRQLREETAKMPEAHLQIAPEQGQFMALVAEMIGAERALEIGTFTGYSAMWIASVLPQHGKLVACDVSEDWTSLAQHYWKKAGLDNKIELKIGPALDILDRMLAQSPRPVFDFAFIDADKTGYDAYYERTLELLRPGGVIAFDNMLQHGRVADEKEQGENTLAIRKLNIKIRDDNRVSCSHVPIGDGVVLARKR